MKIIDFKCKCNEVCTSKIEYSKSFNISFIRKGNFTYKVFRDHFDAYTGYVIIDKPSSEHVVVHNHHIPDECTIVDFSDDFYKYLADTHKIEYKTFFDNKDVQTLFVRTNSKVEYLHYLLLNQIKSNSDKAYLDCLVMDILQWFLDRIDNKTNQTIISTKLKKLHLQTIEKAKDYIFSHFSEDISLKDIAYNCNVSLFHFSRTFKTISNCSPYQFLLNTRLENAKRLIGNTELPINEICFKSGFKNIEHFNTVFKNKFLFAPSYFKKSKNP